MDNQSINFIGERDLNSGKVVREKEVMDIETQNALFTMNKNYEKMINNMFEHCANVCFKDFTFPQINKEERLCVENCQKKYYHTYAAGESILKYVLQESQKIDLFSDKTELDLLKDVQNQVSSKSDKS